MKRRSFLSIHNLFYLLFILVLIFGTTTLFNNINTKDIPTGNAISGEWTSYTSAFSGSGTESDPYKITSAENLAYLASQVNSGTTYSGSYFRQTANIDLSAHYWVPIGTNATDSFRGTYDGDGHTISNMTTSEVQFSGLFGHVSSATIQNLGIESSTVTAESSSVAYAGGIAGMAISSTTISNCYNTGSVSAAKTTILTSSDAYAGGIAGIVNSSTITNCYNTGSITATAQGLLVSQPHAGGIVGYIYASSSITISNCYNIGSVTAKHSASVVTIAGGIAGITYSYNESPITISNCYNTGSVSATESHSGGIAGLIGSVTTISNCYYGGNCTLSYGIGESSSNTGCTKLSNLITQAKTQSWYTTSSNWNSTYPWDFEDTWMIVSGLNDGYPVFAWQLNQLEYTINFDANGGTLNIGAQIKVPYGSIYTMPLTSNVTRTGYTLTGWRAVVNNSTYTYTPGEVITIPTWTMTQTTVTFYAQWRANTYTVSFDAANYISYPVTSVAFNGSGGDFTYSNIDNEIVHSFKFRDNVNMYGESTGFYIDLSALTAEEEYEWSIYVKSTRRHAISIGQEQGGKIDAEVTTEWTRITHKFTATPAGAKAFVIYRGNGSWEVGEVFEFKNLSIQKASDTPADQATGNITVTYGQKYTNLPTPTRYGYNFTGWYTSASSGSQVTSSTQVKTANNHTLYSRWTAKTDCVLT